MQDRAQHLGTAGYGGLGSTLRAFENGGLLAGEVLISRAAMFAWSALQRRVGWPITALHGGLVRTAMRLK